MQVFTNGNMFLKKLLDFGQILKVELTEFADLLDLGNRGVY